MAKNILDFVGNIHFGTIGVTAMVGLIFVAISLLRTIEAALGLDTLGRNDATSAPIDDVFD